MERGDDGSGRKKARGGGGGLTHHRDEDQDIRERWVGAWRRKMMMTTTTEKIVPFVVVVVVVFAFVLVSSRMYQHDSTLQRWACQQSYYWSQSFLSRYPKNWPWIFPTNGMHLNLPIYPNQNRYVYVLYLILMFDHGHDLIHHDDVPEYLHCYVC